jgi:hypothetical protein
MQELIYIGTYTAFDMDNPNEVCDYNVYEDLRPENEYGFYAIKHYSFKSENIQYCKIEEKDLIVMQQNSQSNGKSFPIDFDEDNFHFDFPSKE